MTANEIAQWVIDNRYPKNELEKLSDLELYHGLVEKINECANDKAKYHCEQQVKAIEEKAECVCLTKVISGMAYVEGRVLKDSVRNAYDLSVIK